MIIRSLNKYQVIDITTNQRILVPENYYLDYADDSAGIVSFSAIDNLGYKVIHRKIRITK